MDVGGSQNNPSQVLWLHVLTSATLPWWFVPFSGAKADCRGSQCFDEWIKLTLFRLPSFNKKALMWWTSPKFTSSPLLNYWIMTLFEPIIKLTAVLSRTIKIVWHGAREVMELHNLVKNVPLNKLDLSYLSCLTESHGGFWPPLEKANKMLWNSVDASEACPPLLAWRLKQQCWLWSALSNWCLLAEWCMYAHGVEALVAPSPPEAHQQGQETHCYC